jgi:GNAT superfamily N-acetyltransferase
MAPSAQRVLRRYVASLSDNPEKWRLRTQAFLRGDHRFKKTRKVKEFTLHWRPEQDPGYYEMLATVGDAYDLRVVAALWYGPWNCEDVCRLEGAIEVDPGYRRQGLASAMYDWAEDLSGLKFAPASSHTNDAEAFWSARRKR